MNFAPEEFFDLAGFHHREIFRDCVEVWEVLRKIGAYVRQHLRPDILGTVEKGGFVGPDVLIGRGTVVEPFACVRGPAIIGEECRIRSGAYIRGDVLIGNRCIVGNSTELKNTLMLDDAAAPHYNYCGDSVLGNGTNLGAGTKLSNYKIAADKTIRLRVGDQVIDTGLDYTHQDFTTTGVITPGGIVTGPNVWVNPGEVQGNGIDDDGNGRIDDVIGIDVFNGTSDPMDDNGHGTHVSGTIGAVGNNSLGVVGVNWNVKILPCKFLDSTGNGSIADAVICLDYLLDLKLNHGINIVATNNSYGGLGTFSQTMLDAIKAHRDAGILFIAAAGNFGVDNDTSDFYPANYDVSNVIAVAATDHNDAKAGFSSYGATTVDLGAPGVDILSTLPGNSYGLLSGTSMATPHVSGAAALVRAVAPNTSAALVRQILMNLSDQVASMQGITVSGARLNALRDEIAAALAAAGDLLHRAALADRLAGERADVTLPVFVGPSGAEPGRIHPISQTIDEIIAIFGEMGFVVADGPHIEDDFHNFTALNIPPEHPARQMHDTFYIEGRDGSGPGGMVLRTHTSPVQIRAMKSTQPPLRVIAPGRTYRCDSDMTHSPMFHQVEGLVVDEHTHMGHLKGCLIEFCRAFFGVADLPVRFRPSYFPFTEPSAEVDIGCSRASGELKLGAGGDWLEILGCGMVHPKVLQLSGVDPARYQGFAFGMGIERIAMLKYGIPDLRTFYEADLRWLRHYGFSAFDVPSMTGGLSR